MNAQPSAGDPLSRPRLAITMGDPAGVGPEVIVGALMADEVWKRSLPMVAGDAEVMRRACRVTGHGQVSVVTGIDQVSAMGPGDVPCLDLELAVGDIAFGRLSAAAGEAAYRSIVAATDLAMAGEVDAIVTAPLNKEALALAGHRFPGHTELLASLTGTEEVSMMLTAGNLRVVHVTTHIGLLDAVARIEPALVHRTIVRGASAVAAGLGRPARVAVCGINPHAGEGGLFGRGEEEEKIVPAIEQARAEGLLVEGPLPADTVFFRASRGDFDLVVAMYHDQGHGPVKVLGIDQGVNVTLGLPLVRTSVDHGTAFDIAGSGKADPQSMVQAILEGSLLAMHR
jgi:4-phospho-D-threonate 3-dehydrogenase / 4-phospho-D-erythronate 3-dehydrogenase